MATHRTRALEARLVALRAQRVEVGEAIRDVEFLLEAEGRRPRARVARLACLAALLALLQGAVASWLLHPDLSPLPGWRRHRQSRHTVTYSHAQTLRSGAIMYVTEVRGRCPTPAMLVAGGYLDRSVSLVDGWGRDLHLECREDDVIVHADGPDYHFDTGQPEGGFVW